MTLRLATKEEKIYIKECRDIIKAANFCLLYGGGVKTLANSLNNGSYSESERIKLAKKLIRLKKGIKNSQGFFEGGSDSPIYNRLLKIANSPHSEIPGLGTKISTALRVDAVGSSYMTARTNFCIQASGAEMLSVIITTIDALCKLHNNFFYQFVISVHDIK